MSLNESWLKSCFLWLFFCCSSFEDLHNDYIIYVKSEMSFASVSKRVLWQKYVWEGLLESRLTLTQGSTLTEAVRLPKRCKTKIKIIANPGLA